MRQQKWFKATLLILLWVTLGRAVTLWAGEITFTDAEKAWLAAHPDIRLGFTLDFEPMILQDTDGSLSGIVKDFFDAVNQRAGLNIQIVAWDWPELLEDVNRKSIDGVAIILSKAAERAGLLKTKTHLHAYPALFARHETSFESMDDLIGKTVCYPENALFADFLIEGYKGKIQIIRGESALAGLEMVARGDADYSLGLSINDYLIHKYQLADITSVKMFWDRSVQGVTAIRSDWPLLVTILNKVIASFSPAELNSFTAKWMVAYTDNKSVRFSSEEKDWIQHHPTISLAIDNTYPPLNFVDDQGGLTGLCVEYVNTFAKKAGISIDYKGSIWSIAIEKALNHEVDGIVNADKTQERMTRLNFTVPYITLPCGLVTLKSAPALETIADLDGRAVCAKNSSSHLELIMKKSKARVIPVETLEQGLEQIIKGEAFGVFDDVSVLGYLIAKYNFANLKVNFLHHDDSVGISRIALRNDDPVMLNVFNKVILSLTNTEIKAIQSRWITPSVEKTIIERHFDWRLFGKIIVPVLAVIALGFVSFFLINRRLSYLVARKTEDVMKSNTRLEKEKQRSLYLLQLSQTNWTSEDELSKAALEMCVDLTESQVGYLHLIHPEKAGTVSLYCWSQKALEVCEAEKAQHYPLARAGIWADSIRTGKPVIHNQVPEADWHYPQGHIPLTRHMSIPVCESEDFGTDMLVAVVGVGNKPVDYDKEDIEHLEIFMNSVWGVFRRRRTEDKLMDSQRKLNAIFDNHYQMTGLLDPDGKLIMVNDAALKMIGARLSDVINQPLWETPWFSHSTEEQARLREGIAQALKGEFIRHETMHYDLNGAQRVIDFSIKPILDPDGRTRYLVPEGRDITDRKQAEQTLKQYAENLESMVTERTSELKASSDRIQHILDSSPVGIAISVQGVIRLANPTFKQMFGRAEGDSAIPMYVDPEDRSRLMAIIEDRGRVENHELKMHCRNHVVRDIMITEFPMKFEQALGYLAWFQDITERKQAEKAIRQAKEQAESANRAKSEFLANMSHEIRTPLNGIIGSIQLAMREQVPAFMNRYLTVIHSCSQSLLSIINDILDFSKIEAGKLAFENLHFSLNDTMDHLADVFGYRAYEKGIELILYISPDTPIDLMGDPLRLKQILDNLVSNALKFTEQTGVIQVRAELADKVTADMAVLRFCVSDTGIGIPKEKLDYLFDAFTQADASTTRQFGGTGLGLSISKKLVEMMNGEMWVTSEVGMGSAFNFTARFELATGERKIMPVAPKTLADLNVLVVDDVPECRNIISDMVKLYGFGVTAMDCAGNAIEFLSQNGAETDLIISDWLMPKMDGLEMTQKIRDDLQLKIPVIMLSGYAGEREQRRMAELDIQRFLKKPASPSTLFNAIMDVFGYEEAKVRSCGDQAKAVTIDQTRLSGLRVLVVEDNFINQDIALSILHDFGIAAEVAGDGERALTAVKKTRYDAILMDVQMPNMDGYTATREIRKWESGRHEGLGVRYEEGESPLIPDTQKLIPIIAMTANAMAGDREKALAAGMNDYVAKPIDIAQLHAVLMKWMRPLDAAENAAHSMQMQEITSESAHLPELPGVDVRAGIARSGGSIDKFKELLLGFAKHYGNAFNDVKKSLGDKDLSAARTILHQLKGVVGNLGATRLQTAFEKLEIMLQDQEPAEVHDQMAGVEAVFSELLTTISGLTLPASKASSEQALNKTFAVDDDIMAQLDEIQTCIQDYDTRAHDLVVQIKGRFNGTPLLAEIEQLESKLKRFDFQSAAMIFATITDRLKTEKS